MELSIIVLLSSLLCWSHGVPKPSPAYGIFPLPQVYDKRAPGGFYYFPSLDSVKQQLTPSRSRDDLHHSDVAKNRSRTGTQYTQSMKMFNLSQHQFSVYERISGLEEVIHTSPGYDDQLNYDPDLDEVYIPLRNCLSTDSVDI